MSSDLVVHLREEAKRRAAQLRDVPRDQVVARLVALGEEIRQEAIQKGTAIGENELLPGSFYRKLAVEELARSQGVSPVADFESLLGGWPADEINDGFEEAIARWRDHHLESDEKS